MSTVDVSVCQLMLACGSDHSFQPYSYNVSNATEVAACCKVESCKNVECLFMEQLRTVAYSDICGLTAPYHYCFCGQYLFFFYSKTLF